VKKSDICARFSNPISFKSPAFREGATYLKVKTKIQTAPMIALCFPKFGTVHSPHFLENGATH